MTTNGEGLLSRWQPRIAQHLAQPQHRNAYYLMLTNAATAIAGLLFWLILARLAGLPPADVGLGFAIVALGTTVGVLAKGGFDTALLRSVPGTSRAEGIRLLWFAAASGSAVAIVLGVGLALTSTVFGALPHLGPGAWFLVAAIGILLVVTWLQDAHFLAEGDARFSFQRNLVVCVARLLLPVPIVFLALPYPVALTWALALLASLLAAVLFARKVPDRPGEPVPRVRFVRSALRNVTGSAAEFLPGLVLAPLVLAIDGPSAAGFFGIAWTSASLLFVLSAAIARSALAEMVRSGSAGPGPAIRKGAVHNAFFVLPAALGGIIVAPQALSVFGAAYASEARVTFILLCLSSIFVAPAYLYLGVLRAQDRPRILIAFPALMLVTLLILAPILEVRYGVAGVALAWLLSNAPFGIIALWRLRAHTKEVIPRVGPTPVVRRPHLE